MNSKELLEKYPKAAAAIIDHQTNVFRESLESSDISPEFKEFAKTQVLDYETVGSFMDINPRGVFDVFDTNQVYIQISVDIDNNCFRYSFDGGRVESNDYSSRIDAEKAAIEKAFEILNEKL